MKKKILLTMVNALIGVNYYAQPGTGGTGGSCSTSVLNTLSNCLTGNGVSYYVVDAGGEYYLYAQGTPPPGQINQCIVQYNQDRSTCPSAPLVTDITGTNGSKKPAR